MAYGGIAERNAFGLKPPQVKTEVQPPPPVPKLVLTGITTILHSKLVLLKKTPVASKPGETAKESFLTLSEGERAEDVEILEVDEAAGSVKLNNCGTLMTLTFAQDGARLPNPPPLPPPGAVPAGLTMPVPAAPLVAAPGSFPATPGPDNGIQRLRGLAARNSIVPSTRSDSVLPVLRAGRSLRGTAATAGPGEGETEP